MMKCCKFRLSVLILILANLAAMASDRQPNVIFILADDLGYGELGSYNQSMIATPRLDQLAKEGMRFTRFYAGSTVCAPSRSVLMTGLHVGHTRVRGNSSANNYAGQTIGADDFTIADLMKQAGYATALVGKWGLGEIDSGSAPDHLGFDHYFGFLNQSHAHNHFPSFLWMDGERVELPNDLVPVGSVEGTGYSTNQLVWANDLFFAAARDFIRDNADRPFFLYLAPTVPHANNERSKVLGDGMEVPDYERYAGMDWPDHQKGHAAMNSKLDASVGSLVDLVDSLGLAGDTIIFFTSDNGPHREGGYGYDPEFFNSNGPLRGIKRDLTDGGTRVPLIVRWPGRVKAGSSSDHVGFFGDVMSTLAEIADTAAPDHDGLSLLPVLTGEEEADKHPFLYWEFYEREVTQAVLLDGRWKGIRPGSPENPIILYDQEADPGESRDCSGDHPEVVARIAELMRTQHVPNQNWQIDGL